MLSYVFDDGGRSRDFPAWKRSCGDCVTRAIAIFTSLPYRDVYMAMADGTRSEGYKRVAGIDQAADYGVIPEVYVPFLHAHGIREVWRTRFHGKGVTASEAYSLVGDCLLESHGHNRDHLVAIKDGALRDTWNGLDKSFRYSRIYLADDHPAAGWTERTWKVEIQAERAFDITEYQSPRLTLDREHRRVRL